MTREAVRIWLSSRTPAPPAALATKLHQCLDGAPDATFAGGSLAEIAGRLGVATLRAAVERQNAGSEAAAMDLLAADAFVTYAFEAASDGGEDVAALVRRLLVEVPA